jgi:DNA-binding NtrC family response regulator
MIVRILVVDDEPTENALLVEIIKGLGFVGLGAANAEEGMARLGQERFDMVFADLKIPHTDGLSFTEKVLKEHPGTPVVVITAKEAVDAAVKALHLGATDYVAKPFEAPRIRVAIERILIKKKVESENLRLKEVLRLSSPDSQLVGEDVAMKEIYQLVGKVAPTQATVLILGESGTGKELVARVIHNGSRQNLDTFLALNCAAFTETLLESEIFGHEAGSFTGAAKKKIGLIEVAEGGTLFLDEIGETSPSFQAKLLRVLQEKEFLRVGGTRPIKVNVRILAATNRDIKKEVAEKRFREDLFYRLNVFPITLPPLRDRRKDIPLLISRFYSEFSGKGEEEASTGVSVEVERILSRYLWPGNVRELKNVMERALILAGDDPIEPQHLPREIIESQRPEEAMTKLVDLPLKEAKSQLEARYLTVLMQKYGGNVTKAADHASIGRGTFHDKLKKLGIDPDDFRSKDA